MGRSPERGPTMMHLRGEFSQRPELASGRVDDPLRQGVAREVCGRAQAEHPHDAGLVKLDGLVREGEDLADLGV